MPKHCNGGDDPHGGTSPCERSPREAAPQVSAIFLRDRTHQGSHPHAALITIGLDPSCGGALTRFDVRRRNTLTDVLRPAHARTPTERCSLGASCFPLVPYAGRLRHGRFEFDRRCFQYPLNAPPERHTSHGDGWQRPWTLAQLDRRSAVMSLDADASAPFQYTCTQSIRISENSVRMELNARNVSPHRIPMGFGMHPYFANRSDALIKTTVPSLWQWDHEMMPIQQDANPHAESFRLGQRVIELPVTAEYADWSGEATIDWPASHLRVTLRTTPPLHHVVMWMPPGEDFFCFEPISHATDALNTQCAGELNGHFVLLEPGASARQRFDFTVTLDSPTA